MIGKKLLKMLQARDPWCYHCGATEDLVPHHRRNRGHGGSKLLDRADNLILVCARYNGEMESNLDVADKARFYGHKISQYQDFGAPVFDTVSGIWYVLGERGERWTLKSLHLGCETEPLQ